MASSTPLWTGACSVYKSTQKLKTKYTYTSRYGEEYHSYREKDGFIYVPREGNPMGLEDKRVTGTPILPMPPIGQPRNEEQVRLITESIQLFNKDESHIMQAATGVGKTFMGMFIAGKLGLKTLVVVPKQDIMGMWRDAAKKFLGLTDKDIGYMQQDRCDIKGKKVVIAMVHSLAKDKYPSAVKREFGLTIFDECISGAAKIRTSTGLLRLDTLCKAVAANTKIDVLTYNEELKCVEYKPVTKAFDKGVRKTLCIRTKSGVTIVCTPDHKLLLVGGSWVEAKDLLIGDNLKTPESVEGTHRPERVVEIAPHTETRVYDISVRDNHNFVANGLIVHNCHVMGAESFSKACGMYASKYRLGLSATPYRSDGKDVIFKSHIGEIKVVSESLMLTPTVMTVCSSFKLPRVRRTTKCNKTNKPITVIVPMPINAGKTMHVNKLLGADRDRNNMIAKFTAAAYKKGRRTILFSDLRENHLEKLHPILRSLGIKDKDIAYYVGGMSEKAREKAKQAPVILATYKMCSMATDIPWLDTCVLCTPRSDVVQIIGRILREYPSKKTPMVLDIRDPDSSLFEQYYNKRLRWYRKVGAEVIKRKVY